MPGAKHWKYGEDEDLVLSALRGLAGANPSVRLIPREKVLYNPETCFKKVAVISGGGAGHEPLHSGFVGSNLLDAAVSGAIFASPSTRQIMAAVRATADKQKGALVVVKNYTGDILHFGLVAERAKSEGFNVELVIVADDVAVGRTQNAMVGRRGLAGTAIVHKILGSASAEGVALAELASLGRSVCDNLVTVGASLDRTSVPGREGESEFSGPGVADLGLGIHNEPGEKMPIPEIGNLVDTMYKRLLSADPERHYVDFDDDADHVVLINNIGGTSSLEMYAIAHHVLARSPLKRKPARVYILDFVTSLSSPGFSITLLNLSTMNCSREDALRHLDAATNAPGWKPKAYDEVKWASPEEEEPVENEDTVFPTSSLRIDATRFEKALETAMHRVIEKEPLITKYDTQVGDGDCGETLKMGATSVLNGLDGLDFDLRDPVDTLSRITDVVEDSMGGTSGGIYAIYLTSLVKNLQACKDTEVSLIAGAMKDALYDGLFHYTKARQGGRTLVDTLQPFVDTLVETGDVKALVVAAAKSCDRTALLHAQFGRASYVNEAEFKEEEGGVPDPGAVGLLAIIEGFCESYQ